ncbi:MAG: DNA topoisomerase IV subunit A [Myxococcales bacterium]|nr:DNA topoisomerase IV subunit A [Myxococcales bacterium]
MDSTILNVALSEEAQRLYMNYALSVITSRALPDVRDGLKPVQRRILYVMHSVIRVLPDAKAAKCARIVGDVIGKYHPHGDGAVYDALVRLTQDWVMRAPLVEGQGNFGSIDGDSAAAYRYTEAKLQPVALALLEEINKSTVDFRATFDGQNKEPVVLPAAFPNLLVNGAQGIAVGMATSIPPHNLGETLNACRLLIKEPDAPLSKVMTKLKGPDFPTGGELVSTKTEIRKVYTEGHGTLKVRGTWKVEKVKNVELVVITSVPYAVETKSLIEKIADVIVGRKLPGLVDVRDESTDDVRIVLELKKGQNPELIMAYLAKHTPFQSNVSVNLTCLVPSEVGDVPAPRRLDVISVLKYFLDFRLEVVTRRLTHELDQLEKRLHILDGLIRVFDALDEIIVLIRASDGRQDAAAQIMARFDLDEEQTNAILELRLYRLAKLEILVIQEEAEQKAKEVDRLQQLLGDPERLWNHIDQELVNVASKYADKRRTDILSGDAAEAANSEYSAEDFIVDEDAYVILTRQGWVKRQQTIKDLSSTRVKPGDEVLTCLTGSTRSTVGFFSSKGHCYVCRVADIPASTGYGDPVQKLFKFSDGEMVVGAVSFDPRQIPFPKQEMVYEDGLPCPPYGVAISRRGQALRFPLYSHREPSNRNGRKFARLNDNDTLMHVFIQGEDQLSGLDEPGWLIAAATDGHALAVELEELSLLTRPGKGSVLMKMDPSAEILAAHLTPADNVSPLVVYSDKGKKFELHPQIIAGPRGGRGKALIKRGGFGSYDAPKITIPTLDVEDNS